MEPHTLSTHIFGPFSRYMLIEFLTRTGDICWMVEDAEKEDELGLPAIIRMKDTRVEAMAGLG